MERRFPTWIILVAVLLVAVALRLFGISWDDGIGAHPDERHIMGVAENLSWPSRWNPFESAPNYAYGHLPLYLLAVIRGQAQDVDSLILGRMLAALFDVGTVAVTFALGRRVYDEHLGLLAAGFVALTVLHVQQSHFYTADGLLAFLTVGTLLFAVRLVQGGRAAEAWFAGAWAGLALGTKASSVLLVLPLSTACALVPDKRRDCIWRVGVSAVAVFVLTNPFALVEFPVFARNVWREAAILRGALDVPYTRQYRGTLPYVYPIVQQWRWGMGWFSGFFAFGGLAYAVWKAVRTAPRRGEWIILTWTLSSFAFAGALYAKSPRYLLPLTPALAIYAASLCEDLTRPHRFLHGVSCFLLPGSMLLRCVIFLTTYRVPHPWIRASEWFYGNARPGSVVATEAWDHPLPLDATSFDMRELPIFDEETPEKWAAMEDALAEAEYLVIASRRAYATLAGMPERYPRTARYYKRLFEGDLGFEAVACFSRFASLGPFALLDDPTAGLAFDLPEPCRIEGYWVFRPGPLDESFVVYDRPQVLVFKASE
jgi:4-amino-4-deoxy-L-arabinose transferase-like glycosyltransferase